MKFIQTFYRGNINEVFQKALVYYFVNKFESDEDRAKLLLNLKEVQVEVKLDARRTGLGVIKSRKKKGTESGPSVESKESEFDPIKSKLKELGKEFLEESSITPESYLTDLHPFLLETYKKWSYTEEQLKTVEKVISNPDNIHIGEDIPFESLKTQNKDETTRKANKSHTGELYLSSESIDYETTKPFIPEIPEDITKQGVSGVMKYIHDTYKDTHIIPDLTYYKYLTQLGDQYNTETDPIKKEAILSQIPEVFRDTSKYFYFPGSAFFNESGRWVCPCLGWSGAGFARNADGVEDGWDSNDRVVLLER
jgi:hypothetical protein